MMAGDPRDQAEFGGIPLTSNAIPRRTYDQDSQVPSLAGNQYAEGQGNNQLYLNHETSWSYGSRLSDAEFGVVPNLLPTLLEGEYWYSGVDPLLEDPTGAQSPHRDTHPTIVGSEGFGQPLQGSQISSHGFTEWLGDGASNQQHYGTHGMAKEASEQLLCFGMIHNARAKANGKSVNFLDREGAPLSAIGLYHFELVHQGRCFMLHSPLVGNVAVLNEQNGQILKGLQELCSVSFDAYSSVEKSNKLGQSSNKADKDVYLSVDINLYGFEKARSAVDQFLSSKHTYLQHPSYQDENTLYDNPHFLQITGVTPDIETETLDTAVLGDDIVSVDGENSRISTQLKFDETMTAVFESLTRLKCLKRLEADNRVRTPLLPHQEEALDFMAQREFGPVPDNYSLWERSAVDGQDIFKNKINGIKSINIPIETGGLIADDMGLGKTLTVLAGISRTLERARTFAEETWVMFRQHEHHDGIIQVPSRSSLVLVPTPLLLEEWSREIRRHLEEGLKVIIYHGRGREVDPMVLADSDIVLSTYHTIAAEATDSESALFRIRWFRIILDEAHIIRRTSTKLFRTVSKISAHFRWCLTGTPIQNRLEDIGSLLTFLRIAPFDDMLEFRRHIISPILKGTGTGTYNLRLLLDAICLRRTKMLLNLPTLHDQPRLLDLSHKERNMYEATQKNMAQAIKQQVMTEKSSISGDTPFDPEEAIAVLQDTTDATCAYCGLKSSYMAGAKKRKGYLTTCGHLLCSNCVPRFEAALSTSVESNNFQCPLCPEKVTKNYLLQSRPRSKMGDELPDKTSHTAEFDDNGISTKISRMIEDIKENIPKGKGIVFSCWTRSLDLVGKLLAARQMPYLRLDGSQSTQQRQRTLDDFDSDPSIHVLIMTTGTGAVGLNLTMANFVYILEPQWNPTVEEQAIARVLRLGQKTDVWVIRYIMRSTIEEGMRTQQWQKLALAQVGWDQGSATKAA